MKIEDTVKQVFHPNRITAYGTALCAAGLGLVMGGESTDVYGVSLIVAGNVCDFVDGKLARGWNLETRQGARLDSLADKVKTVATGTYVAASEVMSGGFLLPATVAANFVVDYVSQTQRGALGEQWEEACSAVYDPGSCDKDDGSNPSIPANYWGKTKATIQMIALPAYVAKEVYQNHFGDLGSTFNDHFVYTAAAALGTAAILGGIGVWKRKRK